MELIQKLWNLEDQRLLERLNNDFLSRTTLEIPDPRIRVYIKTDCSNDGMGEVFLKEDVSEESRELEAQEKYGGKYEFKKLL